MACAVTEVARSPPESAWATPVIDLLKLLVAKTISHKARPTVRLVQTLNTPNPSLRWVGMADALRQRFRQTRRMEDAALPVVHADESNNTGENLRDINQLVFTVAGVRLDDQRDRL